MIALFAAAASLLSGIAMASPRVVVVAPRSDDGRAESTVARLFAELRAAGFEVVTRTSEAVESARALDELARAADSFAAVAVVPEGDVLGVDVWVTDRVTGKTVLRRVDASEEGSEANRIAALRAVELLEASLIELDLPLPEPVQPTTPPASATVQGAEPPPLLPLGPKPDWKPRPARLVIIESDPDSIEGQRGADDPPVRVDAPRFGLQLGAAGVGGPGGLRIGFAPALNLSYRGSDFVGGELGFAGPFPAKLEDDAGSAELDQELVLFRLRFDPFSVERWSGFATVGAGAYRLGGSGTANVPHAPDTDSAWAAAVSLGGGARARVSSAVAFVVRAEAFLPTPRPTARFLEKPVARAPTPGIFVMTGGEVGF